MIVVRESLAGDEHLMRELFNLFCEARERGGPATDLLPVPIGLAANRRNLEVALEVADAQGLLAQPLTVDDLLAPVAAATLQ